MGDDVAVWSTDTSRDVAEWSTDTSRDVAVWRIADGDAGLAVRSTNAVPGRSSTNGIAVRIATDELVQRVVDTFSHADSSRSVFFFFFGVMCIPVCLLLVMARLYVARTLLPFLRL